MFVSSGGGSMGVRVTDVNGDGQPDILLSRNFSCTDSAAWINNSDGSGWTRNDTWAPPVPFVGNGGGDYYGAQLADLNGDGLVDLVYSGQPGGTYDNGVYVNNGYGWTKASSYAWPSDPNYPNQPLQFAPRGAGAPGAKREHSRGKPSARRSLHNPTYQMYTHLALRRSRG